MISTSLDYKEGDRNTAFFHHVESCKKSKNIIRVLLNDDSIWVSYPSENATLIQDQFTRLFSSSSSPSPLFTCAPLNVLSSIQIEKLNKPLFDREIETALKVLGSWKAPSLDGTPSAFFQQNCELVRYDLITLIRGLFTGDIPLEPYNETMLIMIMKNKNPTAINQWWPISLCNTTYKVLSRTLAIRLKFVMPAILEPFQGPFTEGWCSTYNAILVFEVLYSILTKDQWLFLVLRSSWIYLKHTFK